MSILFRIILKIFYFSGSSTYFIMFPGCISKDIYSPKVTEECAEYIKNRHGLEVKYVEGMKHAGI